MLMTEVVTAAGAAYDHIIADADDQRTADPGNRAGVADADETKARRQKDGGKGAHQQFDNTGDKRNNRFSQALQAVAVDKNLPQKKVEYHADI